MSTDARTFHALHYFAGLSDDCVREVDLAGGYQAMAVRYALLYAAHERLRAEMARTNVRLIAQTARVDASKEAV